MTKELSMEELANQAAEMEDQSVAEEGGDFEYELPPAGVTVGRLVEYIELGKFAQKPYQGKSKPPAEEVRLTFELLSPAKNIHEYEVEGEKRRRADRISVQLTKKLGERAGFKRLFDKMRYGREDKRHMAQMVGEAFIITVVHNKSENNGKTYANIANVSKAGRDWLIQPPFTIDPISGVKTNYPVPEALSPLKVFIFNSPTKGSWDSLFVDGTRTVKDEAGKETEQSKNWIQERILSSLGFKGSALELMLNNLTPGNLPITKEEVKGEELPAAEEADLMARSGEGTKTEVKGNSADEALAALGLV